MVIGESDESMVLSRLRSLGKTCFDSLVSPYLSLCSEYSTCYGDSGVESLLMRLNEQSITDMGRGYCYVGRVPPELKSAANRFATAVIANPGVQVTGAVLLKGWQRFEVSSATAWVLREKISEKHPVPVWHQENAYHSPVSVELLSVVCEGLDSLWSKTLASLVVNMRCALIYLVEQLERLVAIDRSVLFDDVQCIQECVERYWGQIDGPVRDVVFWYFGALSNSLLTQGRLVSQRSAMNDLHAKVCCPLRECLSDL